MFCTILTDDEFPDIHGAPSVVYISIAVVGTVVRYRVALCRVVILSSGFLTCFGCCEFVSNLP